MSSRDWEKRAEFLAVVQGREGWALVRFEGPDIQERILWADGPCPPGLENLPWVGWGAELSAFGQAVRAGQGDRPLPPTVDLHLLSWAVWPEEQDHSPSGLARRWGLPWTEEALQQAETGGRIFLSASGTASSFPEEAQRVLSELFPISGKLTPPAPSGPPLPPPPPLASAQKAFAQLQAWLLLDHRPDQRAYAQVVEEVLQKRGVVMLEAGPGLGKTFGYLIPLLLHLDQKLAPRAIVSTRTKTLQEQLWKEDLPFLVQHLGLKVSCALLKGRENYACLRRLEQVLGQLGPAEVQVALKVWVARTTTGDLAELAGLAAFSEGQALLAELADDPLRCGGVACPRFGRCLSRQARAKARQSQLVVVNHALLGAHLAHEGGVLDSFSILIVDEAHALPDALRDALTRSLSPWPVAQLLGQLRHGEAGLLAAWSKWIPPDKILPLWAKLNTVHRRFWAVGRRSLPWERSRYRSPEELGDLVPLAEEMAQSLEELASGLKSLQASLPDVEGEVARATADEAVRLADLARFLTQPSTDEFVFWCTQEPQPTLAATPINIDQVLAQCLWPQLSAAVLTSATLAAGDRGQTLARELGLGAAARFATWPSPFPYTGVRALVLPFLPHPDREEFPAELAEVVRTVLEVASRRVMVLFTSRKALLATAGHLAGWPVLVQGRDGEREHLLRRFRLHPPPVALLGLDSFWEGIDLPGEELEILVVARLPFPVPTDPLAQAEAEQLAARGWNPFFALSLPRAVLKFRQGIGRLVRTPTDRGAIVLADPRLATESYGPRFLEGLPVPPQRVASVEELRIALQTLFG